MPNKRPEAEQAHRSDRASLHTLYWGNLVQQCKKPGYPSSADMHTLVLSFSTERQACQTASKAV